MIGETEGGPGQLVIEPTHPVDSAGGICHNDMHQTGLFILIEAKSNWWGLFDFEVIYGRHCMQDEIGY